MTPLIVEYFPALLAGLAVTAALTAIVWSVGMGAGIPIGAVAGAWGGGVRAGVKVLAIVAGAIPVLVLLMWFHFPAQALLQVVVDPFYTAAAVLSVLNVIFVADVVSRSVEAMPSEWTVAARVLGLDRRTILRRIVVPLGLRQIIGPVLFIQISMLHATLFASLISVDELFRVTQRINSIEYDPVSSYSLLVVFFFVVCAPIHVAAVIASRRSSRDLSIR
jgi:ABC-type amino acid transport system permease subunit